MQPCELVTTITAIACSIAQEKSEEELAILAASFIQLGETLETIAVQRELCRGKRE